MQQDERRSMSRLPIEGEHGIGSLVFGSRRLPVLLLDETVNGLGLVAVRPSGIDVGGEVVFESSVRHADGRVGVLRHLTEHERDIYRIGIQWAD